jgi:hypothetical protein
MAVTSFPFGHGLSYSAFEYGPNSCPNSITVSRVGSRAAADLTVAVKITNTSKIAASEVVQIYVSDPVSSLQRPAAELKGFGKVWLHPGESATVTIQLNRDAWAFWDESAKMGSRSRGIRDTGRSEFKRCAIDGCRAACRDGDVDGLVIGSHSCIELELAVFVRIVA